MSFYKDFNDKLAVEQWVTEVREPYSTITVKRLNPLIGAEISGVDLRSEISDEQLKEIRRALNENLVLAFRDQQISQDDHVRFARNFGTPHKHLLANSSTFDTQTEKPEIYQWKTGKDTRYTAGDGWHADVTCDSNPISTSFLQVTKLPEIGGGDTVVANMYLAYEFLSDPMKNLINDLSAVHDGNEAWGAASSSEGLGTYPRNSHPIAPIHPATGKRFLFVNKSFTTHIEGLTRPESDAVLNFLYAHIAQTPVIQNRIHWSPDTLLVWDNWAVQHHAVWDYYPFERWGERVSVYGESSFH